MLIPGMHWIDFDPCHANDGTQTPITVGEHVRVLFTADAFVHKIGEIPIGGINYFRWHPEHVRTLILYILTVLIGWLST